LKGVREIASPPDEVQRFIVMVNRVNGPLDHPDVLDNETPFVYLKLRSLQEQEFS
jgi:hypothetical protein